jgi:hypothetical protein
MEKGAAREGQTMLPNVDPMITAAIQARGWDDRDILPFFVRCW